MTTHSNFGGKTDGADVASAFAHEIKQKTILITGVSPNGLGEALAQKLAAQGPKLLILTGRSTEKVNSVAQALKNAHPDIATRVLKLDLSSFESVRSAAAEVNAYSEPGIDILINNAGIMNIPKRTLSSEGFELHLTTNYLGVFLFTNLIMGKLTYGGGRIVNVSSNGYMLSPFRFTDYNFEDKPMPENEHPPKAMFEAFGLPWSLGYLPEIGYGQSKTALMLYSTQLGKILVDKGVTSVCVHPGAIATNLWRHMPKENVEQVFSMLPMISASQGTSTILVAALDPKLAGTSDIYLENCQVQTTQEYARNAGYAEKLWKLTEGIVSESFAF